MSYEGVTPTDCLFFRAPMAPKLLLPVFVDRVLMLCQIVKKQIVTRSWYPYTKRIPTKSNSRSKYKDRGNPRLLLARGLETESCLRVNETNTD